MPKGRPTETDWPVYASDLTTLVGYMVPGRGFVSLGEDRAEVKSFDMVSGPAK